MSNNDEVFEKTIENDKANTGRAPRRRSNQELLQQQHGYTLSEEDISSLNRWGTLLKAKKTREMYTLAILLVCDHYTLPIHEITPEMWVSYINTVIPEQIVKREISVSTSRTRYYAISGFLAFYASEHPEYGNLQERFLNPANAPTPKATRYPSAAQMAAILQTVKETDPQVYIAMLLAYECALAPGEITNLKITSFKRSEDGVLLLSVPGSSKRLLEIRPDLMQEVENFFLKGGFYGDDWLFHNYFGGRMTLSILQRCCRRAQQPLIASGTILEPYSLISIRGAAIHRMLLSDGAGGTSTARYAGISEAYAFSMQSVGLSSAVRLPGTRHGYNISDLLNPKNRIDADATESEKGVKANEEI